jgi:adenosylhomocysteine nucleosidase
LRLLGIVAALKSEARSLTKRPIPVGATARPHEAFVLKVAGIGAEQAYAAAEVLIAEGATALVSWGSGGALQPKLSAGNLVLPKTIIDLQERIHVTNEIWHERLSRRLTSHLAIYTEPLAQSPTVLTNPSEKFDFFKRNGAIAVDMESGSVAAAAERANLPFMAIRAIADTSDMAIPQSGLTAVDKHGGLRPFHLLGSLLRRPADLLLLNRLRRNFAAARSTLNTVARLAGNDLLAFP